MAGRREKDARGGESGCRALVGSGCCVVISACAYVFCPLLLVLSTLLISPRNTSPSLSLSLPDRRPARRSLFLLRPPWLPAPRSFHGTTRSSPSLGAYIPDSAHRQVFHLRTASKHLRPRRPCLCSRSARPPTSCTQAAPIATFGGSSPSRKASGSRKRPAASTGSITYVLARCSSRATTESRSTTAICRTASCPVISLVSERTER